MLQSEVQLFEGRVGMLEVSLGTCKKGSVDSGYQKVLLSRRKKIVTV